MVLGLFENRGKMDIVTDGQQYQAGGAIAGKVVLTLNKPVKARELRISFFGIRESTRYVLEHDSTHHGRDHYQKHTTSETVMKQDLTLDKEKEYPAGGVEYAFTFQIPAGIMTGTQQVDTGNQIANAVVGAMMAANGSSRTTKWYLDAALDIPMATDVNRKIEVFITQATVAPGQAPPTPPVAPPASPAESEDPFA